MIFFTRTLHRKIFILLLFISLIPAALSVVQTFWVSNVVLHKTVGTYLKERADALAQRVDRLLQGRMEALKVIAAGIKRDEVDFSMDSFDPRKMLRLTAPVGPRIRKTDTFFIASSTGKVLFSTGDADILMLNRELWWAYTGGLRNGSIYFTTRTATSPGGGERKEAILLSKFLWKEKTCILGIISPFDEFFRGIATLPYPESGRFALYGIRMGVIVGERTTADFTSVLKAHEKILLKKMTGYLSVTAIDHVSHLIRFTCVTTVRYLNRQGLSDTDWVIVLAQDISEMETALTLLFWRIILMGIAFILVLWVLGYFLSRRIVNPIHTIESGFNRLAVGDLGIRVALHTGDELETLGGKFNEMAAKLQFTYEELSRRLLEIDSKSDQLALINDINKAINTALGLEETFDIIAREVKKLVRYDRVSIALLTDDKEHFSFHYAYPTDKPLRPYGEKIPLEGWNIEKAITTREPLIKTLSPQNTELTGEETLWKLGMHSMMIVPLISQSGIIGTINMASKSSDAYGHTEKELIMQVADTLALAIEHSRLYTRVSEFAQELERRVKERTEELQKAQEDLIKAEKFAATGTLAANLAHEINNPLGIIKNYLKVLSSQIKSAQKEQPQKELETLSIIDEEIERIAGIVKNLLDFYRPREEFISPININEEINHIVNLMEKTWSERNIGVIRKYSTRIPKVYASIDLVRQVFMNVFRNAEDAIQKSFGSITIKTTAFNRNNSPEGVVVTISDSGKGIREEHLPKIFDPFFTTKSKRGGTGLGLSVTYSILERLGGSIEVESTFRKGTRITIIIPCGKKPETEKKAKLD